jgi:hypothetical protein
MSEAIAVAKERVDFEDANSGGAAFIRRKSLPAAPVLIPSVL